MSEWVGGHTSSLLHRSCCWRSFTFLSSRSARSAALSFRSCSMASWAAAASACTIMMISLVQGHTNSCKWAVHESYIIHKATLQYHYKYSMTHNHSHESASDAGSLGWCAVKSLQLNINTSQAASHHWISAKCSNSVGSLDTGVPSVLRARTERPRAQRQLQPPARNQHHTQ